MGTMIVLGAYVIAYNSSNSIEPGAIDTYAMSTCRQLFWTMFRFIDATLTNHCRRTRHDTVIAPAICCLDPTQLDLVFRSCGPGCVRGRWLGRRSLAISAPDESHLSSLYVENLSQGNKKMQKEEASGLCVR